MIHQNGSFAHELVARRIELLNKRQPGIETVILKTFNEPVGYDGGRHQSEDAVAAEGIADPPPPIAVSQIIREFVPVQSTLTGVIGRAVLGRSVHPDMSWVQKMEEPDLMPPNSFPVAFRIGPKTGFQVLVAS